MRILIYRVSSETLTIIHRKVFGTKLSGKPFFPILLYHFAIFALGIILLKVISDNKLIINELISIN